MFGETEILSEFKIGDKLMKNLFILLLVIGLFSGCAKNEPTLPKVMNQHYLKAMRIYLLNY